MTRGLLGSLGLLLALASAAHGAVTVGATLDRTRARVGEQVFLTLTVEGEVRGLEEPVIEGLGAFDVYRRGNSQRVSWTNGRMNASHSFTYLLIPKQPGHHTIPSIDVVVDGNTYRSVPVELEVLDASRGRPVDPDPPPSSPPTAVDGNDDYFVTMTVDQDDVVVGEQIVLSFAFYRATRSNLFDSPEYTPPTTEGFLREDLPPERRYDRVIRSRRYGVTEIRYALFPTRAGDLTIGEAVVRIPDDMFSSFLNRRRNRRRGDIFLRAPAIQIRVRPLPDGAPAAFEGTVGSNLELSASVDRTELAVGDALTLTLTLEGDGYLGAAKQPVLAGIEGFRVHDAGSAVDSRPLGGQLHGRLQVEKLLIPTEAGETQIPAQTYAYYDTGRDRYVSLTTRSIPIQVLASDAPASAVFTGAGRSEIELLAQDILHLKPVVGSLKPAAGPLPARALFWTMLAMPGLAWVVSGLVARRRQAALSDPERIRRRRALRDAQEILAQEGAAADRAAQAIAAYVAAKSGREAAGLTTSFVEQWLGSQGVDRELQERVRSILDQSDQLRFAPGAADAASLAEDAKSVLVQLEEQLQ